MRESHYRLYMYLRQVQVDLITIKVCVEAGAVGVVHPDGALTSQHTRPAGRHRQRHRQPDRGRFKQRGGGGQQRKPIVAKGPSV